MRMRGVEPPRAEAHRHLKPARLPIPPHPQLPAIVAIFTVSSRLLAPALFGVLVFLYIKRLAGEGKLDLLSFKTLHNL